MNANLVVCKLGWFYCRHYAYSFSVIKQSGMNNDRSKLKVENMMEAQLSLMDAQWTDDKTVSECMKCQKTFSVSRRKVNKVA